MSERLSPNTYNAVNAWPRLAAKNDLAVAVADLTPNVRNERLAKTYGLRLAGLPFKEAVHELARARNDDGYMASVEEKDGHLVLTEHNCPIYDVAQRFPHACQQRLR